MHSPYIKTVGKEKTAGHKPEETAIDLLQDALSQKQRALLIIGISIWMVSLVIFWNFWLQDYHIVDWPRFIVNSLLLLWSMVLPGYFYFFVFRMKRVRNDLKTPQEWRVAMVVTKTPSEPFKLVKRTLDAMIRQKPEHDNWLADEDPNEETKLWCLINNVHLISRKGIKNYNNETWPRRTKSKEGNLSYFYDKVGYCGYDFVVQLDADHVPQSGYLMAMLIPFLNQSVGYVSAPSICNSNQKLSWSARGRLHAEGIMHGALQAGYSLKYAPLCIGSHYAIRTNALKDIGGLGPELAEDHSTTLMMQSKGWKGVHALDAIASGEGPRSLSDCMIQEFQWSRSLMIILIQWLPKHWSKLPAKLRFQFLFSELWYPIFSFTMFIGYLLPIVAVYTKTPWVRVSFLDFILHATPVTMSIIAIALMLRQFGLLRPVDAKIMSWEAVVFQLVRWPWALYGVISGFISGVLGKEPTFSITRKSGTNNSVLDWKYLMPYVAIIVASSLPLALPIQSTNINGYFFFLIMNSSIYSAVLIFIIRKNYKEAMLL